MFHGNEAGIVPRFPSNIRLTNLAIFNTDFSILLHTIQIVWQFQDFLIHREIWRPNCETVSLYPKP